MRHGLDNGMEEQGFEFILQHFQGITVIISEIFLCLRTVDIAAEFNDDLVTECHGPHDLTVEYDFWSFDHRHSTERNLFLIRRIEVVSLGYLRWDQEPGDSPYRSSGFWTGSLDRVLVGKALSPCA
ncbi:unnamed protein product [Nesidiocoris tenuis]|uniref:Uncharacterized protein n=1 Tax=Nesidiocoris tenuis TaxID=355587 RepID=A0A6H5HH28_9HEMI|nr:unnamed protein product [Nesidiocoris tenuis]